jgi:hypothetical protein
MLWLNIDITLTTATASFGVRSLEIEIDFTNQ